MIKLEVLPYRHDHTKGFVCNPGLATCTPREFSPDKRRWISNIRESGVVWQETPPIWAQLEAIRLMAEYNEVNIVKLVGVLFQRRDFSYEIRPCIGCGWPTTESNCSDCVMITKLSDEVGRHLGSDSELLAAKLETHALKIMAVAESLRKR